MGWRISGWLLVERVNRLFVNTNGTVGYGILWYQHSDVLSNLLLLWDNS